ncbi:MAG TPA: cysteine desulfurase NifS [Syntrophomonadaceae bacterium]|nr:cysteine desulfurase NifS [Syntrophomonadaceae bacterium]
MNHEIYLDNNATTIVDKLVFEEMRPYFCELYGNPSSTHFFGAQIKQKMKEARKRVAALLGAQSKEIIFTSCGTESDSTAIYSALKTFPNRRHIIISQVEHLAVLSLCRSMAMQGYRVSEIGVDQNGNLDMEQYKRAIDDDTAFVSFMWANNETGVIFPVEEAAAIAKEKGALFHTDAVQAVGKVPINMAESQIDMLSLSGHKLHAPKGIGVLYVRQGTPLHPFLVGGHQEQNKRAGTENTASVIALGKACQLADEHMHEENTRVKALRDRLQDELLAEIPNSRVNGGNAIRLPNTLSIAFEFAQEDAILQELSDLGICASSGSACNSETMDPSHVLLAMGIPMSLANGSIRFSLSRYTSDDEIDTVISELPPIIERIRQMSLFDREFTNEV